MERDDKTKKTGIRPDKSRDTKSAPDPVAPIARSAAPVSGDGSDRKAKGAAKKPLAKVVSPKSSVADAPAADVIAAGSSKVVPPNAPRGLESSVEILRLPRGLYAFSVRGAPASMRERSDLHVPAIQVGPAPGFFDDGMEVMAGPGATGNWLSRAGDALVVRISSAAASVLLTSIRMAGMAPLEINLNRIDGSALEKNPAAQPTGTTARAGAASGLSSVGTSNTGIPLRIVAHIQNRGDVPFADSAWAGYAGERLAIEAFSITPLDRFKADQVEYKALTADKVETPWVSGGAFCGTRGKGLPLIGFCVRMKGQSEGARFDCEYIGVFASGKTIGPIRNGAPCWSTVAGDFIEAIQVRIVEKKP